MNRCFFIVAALGLLVAHPARGGVISSSAVRVLLPEEQSGSKTSNGGAQLQEALKVFEGGDIERAYGLLKAASAADPNLPPSGLMMARLLLSKNRKAEAQTFLEAVAAQNPKHPGVYLTLGQLALAEGKPTVALLCFEKVAALLKHEEAVPTQTHYYLTQSAAGRAAVAEQRGQWEDAERALATWLEVEPDSGNARHRMGRVLFHLGRYEEALQQFKHAVKVDPALDPAPVTMALLYQQQGNEEQAKELMEEAVRSHPDTPKTRFHYGRWLLESGRTKEAIQQAKIILVLDPENTPAMVLMGHAARASGRWEEAEKWFAAVHKSLPGDPASANFLALALVEQEDRAKQRQALQLAQENAEKFPTIPEVLATLGWVHYRLGNKQEAEQTLRRASSNHKLSSDTAYYLAHVLTDRGEQQDAITLLESAINAPGRFGYRDEAIALLKRLNGQPQEKEGA